MMTTTLSFFFLLAASSAFAWGPDGHKIVAQIAENNLTPIAQEKIRKLIPGTSLADVSNWADIIKGKPEWKFASPWHYVDVPDGHSYEDIEHAPEGNIITSITELVMVLKNKTSRPVDRQSALKFIIHFVGDIHQPLHVGRPTDRGGNEIEVNLNGRAMNLHSLWDSAMIKQQQMDYAEYARYLETNVTELSYEGKGFPFSKIIDENMNYRSQIYDFSRAFVAPIILTDAYVARNLQTLNSRLLLGGQRLAALLNEIFK